MMHLLLRAKSKDRLIQSINPLYIKICGAKTLKAMAYEYKFSFKPYADQASKMQHEQRVRLYVEEFIAGLEVKMVYATLQQRIKQALRSYVCAAKQWFKDK